MARAKVAFLAALSIAATLRGDCACPEKRACPADPAPEVTPGKEKAITGVFLTLDEDVDWQKLSKAGITTVIVQSVQFNEAKAKKLLERAPAGFRIYFGLHHDADFSPAGSTLSVALATDLALADAVAKWPKASRIAGWYVSQEIYNFRLATPEATFKRGAAIRDEYLRPLTRHLKKPVLISPYFHPTKDLALLDATDTARLFRTIFDGSGIHMVLLQDSIGARNDPGRIGCCTWDRRDFEKQMVRYERAVQQALKGTGVRFGVNVESFEFSDCRIVAAPTAARKRQLQVLPDDAELVVSFSYEFLFPKP